MPPLPPQLAKELDAALAKLEAADPAAAGPCWGALHKLLLKAKHDPHALMRVVGARDLAAMRRAVARAKGEAVEEPAGGDGSAPRAGTGSDAGAATGHGPGGAAPAAAEFDPALLQDALRLFRKRLKLLQLDADSRLGHGPTSGTGQYRIQSMAPPREHPVAVWDALARAGKLRREPDGFYSLIEQPGGAHW